jgi:hypothetical protein
MRIKPENTLFNGRFSCPECNQFLMESPTGELVKNIILLLVFLFTLISLAILSWHYSVFFIMLSIIVFYLRKYFLLLPKLVEYGIYDN